ncbi:RING-type E3 ubiquitin transferase [Quillaja saponaria]|uniref:U-box domain-containing protein n=1 Tax=Quillaja saponaria TaxID=32244 RepID=A0AAD7KSY7_QUISA|nr:RING-type E3 ubiquitin transferase [Quillaja saponaria]
MTIPHLFRCPISLDLFEDPVTLCTGQTYDRSCIEKWLAAGNLTCPVTMQKLQDPSIVPNHTLRHLIDKWRQLGTEFDPGYSADIAFLSALKHNLESDSDTITIENKLQTLEKIRALSDEYCSSRKSCFLQLGFLSLLLELVFGRVESQLPKDHMGFIELALSCTIKLLPLGNLQALDMLKEDSKLLSLQDLFEQGTIVIKICLCHLIEALESPDTKEVCFIIGNTQRLLHQIVLLLYQNFEASMAGVKALTALCSLQCNKENLVRSGAVDGIITYISSCERQSLALMAMATIENLLGLESGKEALVNNPNGVEVLVKMVFRVSNQECSDTAVGSLLIVCYYSCRAREEAIGAGVLTQLLLLLQSQCSNRTKTKARMLLKLLRSKWVEDHPNQV